MKQKTKFFTVSVLILSSFLINGSTINAQELSVHQGFWSLKYYEDNNQLDKKEFESKINSHTEAGELWKSYKSNYLGASIFSGIGGFGLGYWITADRRDNKTPWIAMAVGGTVLGAVFGTISAKKRRDALFAYNGQFDTGKIRVGPSRSGIGLAIQF